ncbi:MAG: tetratricopeptide repeat protein [Planctomycetes bacterium]|nr:tetratricopeptide repeat protein [Planctomycetota bacterium]
MTPALRVLVLLAALVGGGAVSSNAQADELARARECLEEARYQDAYDLLKPGFDGGDRAAARLRLLGRAAMGLARPAEAVACFGSLAADPEATAEDLAQLAWAHHEHGAVLAEAGEPARSAFLAAAQAARHAVALDATSLTAWRFLGAALEGAGNPEGAERAYRDGIEAVGESGRPLRFALAALLAGRGETEASLAALAPLAARGEEEDAEVALLRARIWAGAGRMDRAAEILSGLLGRAPDCTEAYGVLWSLFSGPEYRAAGVAVLEAVLERDPAALTAWGYLGNFHRLALNLDAAERAYRKCLEIRPDYAWAHRALGELFQARADLARDPLDRPALRDHLTRAVGAFLDYLDHAATQGTEDPTALPIIDWLIYDLARTGLDPGAAYAASVRLLQHHPESAAVHHTLGLIAQDLGRFEEAEAALRKSLAGCPADNAPLRASYLVNLGLFYEAWNKYPQAREQYESAARLSGKGRLDALENLGKLAYKLGNPTKALEHFKAVLDEEPDRPESLFYYHYCRRWIQRETYFRRR